MNAQEETEPQRLGWCEGADPDERREGRHFYCDDPPPEEDQDEPEVRATKPEPPAPAILPKPPAEVETATERLAAITAEIEELRAEAILDPRNGDKVEAYMRAQGAAVNRASEFSDTWRRVVWATPELDYTLQRPTNSVAGPLYHDERNRLEYEALEKAAKDYGLFFIFESAETCVSCAVQGEILANLSEKTGVAVIGVSRDGSALPSFPAPLPPGEALRSLGLDETPVPALVLVRPDTDEMAPIAFGAIAEDQILERIFVVTQSEPGELY